MYSPDMGPKMGSKIGGLGPHFRASPGQLIGPKSRCRPSGAPMYSPDMGSKIGVPNRGLGPLFWASPGEGVMKESLIY